MEKIQSSILLLAWPPAYAGVIRYTIRSTEVVVQHDIPLTTILSSRQSFLGVVGVRFNQPKMSPRNEMQSALQRVIIPEPGGGSGVILDIANSDLNLIDQRIKALTARLTAMGISVKFPSN